MLRAREHILPNDSKEESLAVSVVVPVFHGGKHFAGCIASIAAALRPQDELIVVANGEGDGAWRAALVHPQARILHNTHNGGPAGGRNFGAASATGDILLFIDADVSVQPDCIARVARVFSEEEDVAAVIGSYDEDPGEKNFLSQFKNLFHHYVHQHGAIDASTFWGGCGAVRRQIFVEIGGFNPARPTMEDIDFGYRLRAVSHRIRLVHELQVKHWKRWSPVKLLQSDLFDRATPWTELILDQIVRQKRTVPSDLNLGLTYKISLTISFLLIAAVIGALFQPSLSILAIVYAGFFVVLHAPLLRFFARERGWRFSLQTIPWRFAYDICSGLGLAYGAVRFVTQLARTRPVYAAPVERIEPLRSAPTAL